MRPNQDQHLMLEKRFREPTCLKSPPLRSRVRKETLSLFSASALSPRQLAFPSTHHLSGTRFTAFRLKSYLILTPVLANAIVSSTLQTRNGCSESPCNLCKVTQLVSSRVRIPAEVRLIIKSPWETNILTDTPSFGILPISVFCIICIISNYIIMLHGFFFQVPKCSVKFNSVFLKGCPRIRLCHGQQLRQQEGKFQPLASSFQCTEHFQECYLLWENSCQCVCLPAPGERGK